MREVTYEVEASSEWPVGTAAARLDEERRARITLPGEMPMENNFEFRQGERVRLRFTMNPAALVTGWTISLVAKRNVGDADVALEVSEHTMTQAAGFMVVLPSEKTVQLRPDTYVYEMWRMDAGEEYILSSGILTVLPSARFTR